MLKNKLNQYIEDGLVSVQKHPSAELYIYNYTQKCQFEREWDEITIQCRGLIMNDLGEVVARPFAKFFNYEEHSLSEIPNIPFDVFEKMDGSLGILYWIEDKPFIATRGSFNSDQAIKATEILYQKYTNTFDLLHKEATYLFEIIYPDNKIVVEYGDREELVLLAILDNKTGKDLHLHDIGLPIVPRYDGVKDIQMLKKQNLDNAEGYVLRFENGFRVKIKFEEYVRLHRIVTQCSSITIWEHLMDKRPFDELLEKVPDEFFAWVTAVKSDLENQFQLIENQCKASFKILETRKETAAYFFTQKYPAILFLMLENKDYSKNIWRLIRPKFAKNKAL